jgi:hypothetical protein
LTTGRFANVLNSHVNTLLDDSATNALVNLNTNSSLWDIPDFPSFSVVIFVGHTFVDSSISLDIHNISNLKEKAGSITKYFDQTGTERKWNLENGEVVGHSDGPMLSEGLGEEIASTSTQTKRVGHGEEKGRKEEKRKRYIIYIYIDKVSLRGKKSKISKIRII